MESVTDKGKTTLLGKENFYMLKNVSVIGNMINTLACISQTFSDPIEGN